MVCPDGALTAWPAGTLRTVLPPSLLRVGLRSFSWGGPVATKPKRPFNHLLLACRWMIDCANLTRSHVFIVKCVCRPVMARIKAINCQMRHWAIGR